MISLVVFHMLLKNLQKLLKRRKSILKLS